MRSPEQSGHRAGGRHYEMSSIGISIEARCELESDPPQKRAVRSLN